MSKKSGNCPDHLETLGVTRKKNLDAQKLHGWQCHPITKVFCPLTCLIPKPTFSKSGGEVNFSIPAKDLVAFFDCKKSRLDWWHIDLKGSFVEHQIYKRSALDVSNDFWGCWAKIRLLVVTPEQPLCKLGGTKMSNNLPRRPRKTVKILKLIKAETYWWCLKKDSVKCFVGLALDVGGTRTSATSWIEV